MNYFVRCREKWYQAHARKGLSRHLTHNLHGYQ
jgi:hypothetical protein